MARDDEKEPDFLAMVRPLAYGLSGSNFITVIQFLHDEQVSRWGLFLLVAMMPPLIISGVMFNIFEGKAPPHPDAIVNAEMVVLLSFVFAAAISLLGYAKIFSAVSGHLSYALGIGVAACFGILSLVNWFLHRGVKKKD